MGLYLIENRILAAWKVQFCGMDLPPVLEVDDSSYGGTTLRTRRQRSRGS